jgi:hypothetical protein
VYYLLDIPHTALFPQRVTKRLHRVDERTYQSEILGKAFKNSG